MNLRENSNPSCLRYRGTPSNDSSEKVRDLRQGTFDEFSLDDMMNCLNFIGGRCQGYLESPRTPGFYYRTTPELQLIWGAQDGSFFQEDYSTIDELSEEIAKDEKRAKQWWDDQVEENKKAYENRIENLRAIASETRKNYPSRDDKIDYPGYSEAELAFIRRGEARCLLRQLNLRFGEIRDFYKSKLELGTSSQLACWSKALIDAQSIKDVFTSTLEEL